MFWKKNDPIKGSNKVHRLSKRRFVLLWTIKSNQNWINFFETRDQYFVIFINSLFEEIIADVDRNHVFLWLKFDIFWIYIFQHKWLISHINSNRFDNKQYCSDLILSISHPEKKPMENSKEEKKEWNFENYHPQAFSFTHVSMLLFQHFFFHFCSARWSVKKNHIRKNNQKTEGITNSNNNNNNNKIWQTFTNIIT